MATATTTRAEDEDGHKTVDVVTPSAGESVSEGTILEWHFKVGDPIRVDETIVEISTDKVDVELPAPATGTVSEILAPEGETVTVGQVIARIVLDGAAPAGNGQAAAQAQASPPEQAAPEAEASPEQASEPGPDGGSAEGGTVDVLTPAAGESVSEGTILEWRVKPGDPIKVDETIVEISTDKVDTEVPAPASGTVRELLVAEGETVDVGTRIAVIDTGIKASMVRELTARGARVSLHPCSSTAEQLLAEDPDAIFLANGPGDPAALGYVVDTVRDLVGKRPLFGICLGHQLLCRAVGLETYKLPFGHRGANHPVKDLTTGKIEITSQNHGFAVLAPDGGRTIDRDEPVRWETDFGAAELSHINLYDRTVEGLVLRDVQGATVQYHPEAGPGPNDALYQFDRFLDAVRSA